MEECSPPGPCTTSSYDTIMSAWADIRGPCPAVPEPTPSLEHTCGTKYHTCYGKVPQEIPIVFNAEEVIEMENRDETNCPACMIKSVARHAKSLPTSAITTMKVVTNATTSENRALSATAREATGSPARGSRSRDGRRKTSNKRGKIERGGRRGSLKRATEGSTL
jgi:hypothetical protein